MPTTAHTNSGAKTVSRVAIIRDVENARVPSTKIRAILAEIMRREKSHGVLQVVIVDDLTMRRLNRRFKGKDTTTDVLSFPLPDAMPGIESATIVGEIYCNYSHCKRWIAENGGTIAGELLRLAVHGCLHLYGYDHHRPKDQIRMLRAENRYLASGGLIRERVFAAERNDD